MLMFRGTTARFQDKALVGPVVEHHCFGARLEAGFYLVLWIINRKFPLFTKALTESESLELFIRCVSRSQDISGDVITEDRAEPAQHLNLKLGPGLLQSSNASSSNHRTSSSVISTRAGTLNHSANGSRWWVESNSRRVSSSFKHSKKFCSDTPYQVVRTCSTGVSYWCCCTKARRGIPS